MEKKRKPQRPRPWIVPKEMVCLRAPVEIVEALDALTYRLKESRAKIIIDALRAYLAAQPKTNEE